MTGMKVFVLALLTVFLITLARAYPVTDYGFDGEFYVYASQTFIEQGKLLNWDGHALEDPGAMGNTPMTLWGFGHPVLLAAGQLIGLPLALWIAIIQAVSLTVFTACLLLICKWLDTPGWVTAGCILAPLMLDPVHALSQSAYSDLVFIALTMTTFVWLARYPERLFVAVLLAGSTASVRYVGVTVIATGGLYYWIVRRQPLTAVVFVVGSCTPLAAWAFRNYALTGQWFGHRYDSWWTWQEVTHGYSIAIISYLKTIGLAFGFSYAACTLPDLVNRRVRVDFQRLHARHIRHNRLQQPQQRALTPAPVPRAADRSGMGD